MKPIVEILKTAISSRCWLGIEKNGRRLDVPADSLSQEYVQLDAVSASSGFDPTPDGVLDTSGQTDWDTAPPPTGDANVNDDGGW